jgi:hypothetical protein
MDTKINKTSPTPDRYITYAFYQSDGRRISAFAEHIKGDNKMKIYLYNCSTRDQFSRKYAKGMHIAYKDGMWGTKPPQILEVDIDHNCPKKDFLRFMTANYCRISQNVLCLLKVTPIIMNNKGEVTKKLKSKAVIKTSKI